MTEQNFQTNVRWNDHPNFLGTIFPEMLAGGRFVDVTLACEGRQIRCHRVILAASSPLFLDLLEENPAQHPIIILPRDVKFWMIYALVEFMYKGEISVPEDKLEDFLNCAEILQIQALSRPAAPVSSSESEASDFSPENSDTEQQCVTQIKKESPEIQNNFTEDFKCEGGSSWSEQLDIKPTNLLPPIHQHFHESLDQSSSSTSSSLLTKLPEKTSHSTAQNDFSRKLPIVVPEKPTKGWIMPPLLKTSKYTYEDLLAATRKVQQGMSIRQAAKPHQIPAITLHRFLTRNKIKSFHPYTRGGKQPYKRTKKNYSDIAKKKNETTD